MIKHPKREKGVEHATLSSLFQNIYNQRYRKFFISISHIFKYGVTIKNN